MSNLPTWYPDPNEAKPAPGQLLLVQAFVNTRSFDDGTDLLTEPETARRWLVDAGLISSRHPLGAVELDQARNLRESLRTLLETDVGAASASDSLAPLRKLTATHCARLTVGDDGDLTLENPRHMDLADGLFGLLLVARAAQEDGTWARLRTCANPDCRWAFYDRSRNQQGSWCDMAVCGNRLKNRNLRARRR